MRTIDAVSKDYLEEDLRKEIQDKAVNNILSKVARVIADDQVAISFQNTRQYRKYLVEFCRDNLRTIEGVTKE